ncbi:MAG TPA: hypothetical protein ENJ20_00775 [Bacteroidetes bacterium]|nr:hypothetical protein [Bacteroidota bacterium]
MTIYTLLFYIAIVAVVLTGLVGYFYKGRKNRLMTFLQNFCGALFIFSGFVKAVDPMGTAFKMEQYFSEFYYTFSETAMSFIAPLFPWMSEHSIAISVGMIVFEIVLGVMLLLGSKPKLTSWAFLLLVVFFTILTGFTYLTGYVPNGVNFFEFDKWGEWVETNMRVTDCGCFGDFLKLKPKTSFFKDVFLLFPALYFVFRHRDMHRLFTSKVRKIIIGVTTVGFLVFCIRNFAWDEPVFDFRPFAEGKDVRATKLAEEEAAAGVRITHYRLTNKATGKVITLPYEQYLKEFKNYPKNDWEFEQIKTKPAIEATKISDFEIADSEGNDMTGAILTNPDYAFMVTSYKLKELPDKKTVTKTIQDTIFTVDTVRLEGTDSVVLVKKAASVQTREIKTEVTRFDPDFVNRFKNIINPVVEQAAKDGYEVFAITAPNAPEVVDDFRHATQSAYPFYIADDLLIKTIQRSNPGLVLWKDGKIVKKWHYKKLPSYQEIKAGELK